MAKVHLIGNAHIDPVWLWRWQEGYAEIKATFRSALDRLDEFPEFVFTCACAAYYVWIEENAPEMFEEIKIRVAEKRWIITGGWWIQPDCNLPSGESFARHSLYGQRYFLEKFGVMAKVGYNVDSFGHNGMLPQILKQSGMDYYLFMRPEAHEKDLPQDLFRWESADGSQVTTFRLSNSYANFTTAGMDQKILRHHKLAEEKSHPYMSFYGVGNHGGGPTMANLHMIEKIRDEHGRDDIVLSSPNQYFKQVEQDAPEMPVIKDELQRHAVGCYSAHSESKALNRKAEHRLISAEKFASLAHLHMGLAYPSASMRVAWENVMFNHFHDIMGGCSIREAFDDVRESYGESLHLSAKVTNAAIQKMSWAIDTMKPEIKSLNKEKDWQTWEQKDCGAPFVLFNSLSWDIEVPVQINKEVAGLTDETGHAVPVQTIRGPRTNGKRDKWDSVFVAKVPAMGHRVYWTYGDLAKTAEVTYGPAQAVDHVLENDFVKVTFDAHTGYIASMVEKATGLSLLANKAAVPIVIDEWDSDTWGHGLRSYRNEIGRFGEATIEVLENGPVRSRIRVTSRYNQSILRQDFMLYAHNADLKVEAQLDWREKHKMLKLAFPVQVEEATHTAEIPYGSIERASIGDEVPGHQWVNLSGEVTITPVTDNGADAANIEVSTNANASDPAAQSYQEVRGISFINNSKYSYDVLDNEFRLTVVRSPIFADHFGVRDTLVEYMDQGLQEFQYMVSPHQGNWQESKVVRKAYELNVAPVPMWETYHHGALPQMMKGITVSSDQVIVSAWKPAEDGNGWIVRAYETLGKPIAATFELPALNATWTAEFGKHQIKTFRIVPGETSTVTETNFVELPNEKDS